MNFTITKIDSQGVWAKEDNPYIKPQVNYPSMKSDIEPYLKWQEAEDNRKEYQIEESELDLEMGDWYLAGLEFDTKTMLEYRKQITGDIKDNKTRDVCSYYCK